MIERLKNIFKAGTIRNDVLQIYILQFLVLIFGLFSSIIIARVLGPEAKGTVDLFNLLNSFILDFGMLGFGSSLLYYLANKQRPLKEIHGTGLVFALAMGSLMVLLGGLFLPICNNIFPGLSYWMILLAFILAPIIFYRLIWTNIMIGINQSVKIYQITLYFTIINLMVLLVLWKINLLNAASNIILISVIATLNALVAFYILYKREPVLKPSADLAKKSLNYGLVIYVGNIANIMHFKIAQVLINYWLGTKSLGIYALSARWAEMLFILDAAITTVAISRISSISTSESYSLTNHLFKIQLLISGASGILLMIMAYPIINILYGESYKEAILPLILLIPGVVAWSVSKILSEMLTYNCKLASYCTKISILGLVINVLFNYSLIKVIGIGIVGASISATISYSIVALLTWYKVSQFKHSLK